MFDLEQATRFFFLLAQKFDQERTLLDTLDGAIGDGDHGTTVARAFQAVANRLDANPPSPRLGEGPGVRANPPSPSLGELFDMASQALAEHAGGAIGPLLAAFFAEGGLVFQGKTSATSADLLQFLSGGLEALQEIGGAHPGDKTLVDALAPAVQAFRATVTGVADLGAAVEAARAGAQATQTMTARFGRARFLGERSLGHMDPGAVTMTLILETLSTCLQTPPSPLAQQNDRTAIVERRPGGEGVSPFTPPAGKLINHPGTMIQQDNEGLALAYPRLVHLDPEGILTRAQPKAAGKVGLAIGHGGGHTPSMGGFIGPGLLDADVYGPLFTCASGIKIARAIAAADRGAGVVLLVSNHSGDVLNAKLAVRRATQLGIPVEPVLLGDDIATAPRQNYQERRGLGGLLFALKIGGAAAEAGWPLPSVTALMRKTNARTASLAVAVRTATHPVTGKPLFDLPEGQIEVGTGVHGEIGVYRGKHLPADPLIDLLLERLVPDLASFPEKQLLVFLNGSGGTSKMELHILYRRVHQSLLEQGFTIHASVVDSLFTTQEMGGFSLSLCALDPEMLPLWDAPAAAPSFHWP